MVNLPKILGGKNKAFLEAENKIEEARVSGAKGLDLRHFGLTELPSSIGQLSQLLGLNLSHNSLSSLPPEIENLSALRVISLASNKFINLPNSIYQLQNLRVLGATDNKIEKISGDIKNLSELRSLYLGGDTIIRSTSSKEFSFHSVYFDDSSEDYHHPGNNLTDLHANLATLPHLDGLTLNNNPLNPELAAAYEQGLARISHNS